MPLSWNEIRQRAITFSKSWSEASRERAEAQTFWNEFFDIFGLRRRLVATFEEPVKNLKGKFEFIDLFWKGKVIAEHKSRGKDLSKAGSQAMNYVQHLIREGREIEAPKYILVSDFTKVALHNLDEGNSIEFSLKELHEHIHDFAFNAGYETRRREPEDPVNLEAVKIMGELHDTLETGGYSGHDLERLLVRVLFCLFADDTGIFEPDTFKFYIENNTKKDGSDLGIHIARFFGVLNTPEGKRQKTLDEQLADLPYVNGALFGENLGFADFNRDMREALLRCCRFNWSQISPAVFGSLFQSVMLPLERRQIGAHYTSERDILKLIRSLFLDSLHAEFKRVRGSKPRLKAFHEKLAGLRFFDPACGCGNFLVITYRELRLLEIGVLLAIHGKEQRVINIASEVRVDVDAMFGIEIEEWPARIAEVAIWLVDHQMNQKLSETFGEYFVRLPLTKSATIVNANALRIDWTTVITPKKCSYILGNPPFIAKHLMTEAQQADIDSVWNDNEGAGVLDYVTCWYRRAVEFIQGTKIRVAFVSTNSISQGEQVYPLWNELFTRWHIKIQFAHRTFAWVSEARGAAHVHVVIIGFAAFDNDEKILWDYHDVDGNQGVESRVSNIGPYLIEGGDIAIRAVSHPLTDVPRCQYGSKPADDGNLIIEEQDRQAFLAANPSAKKYLRPLLCAEEYLHGTPRWCLWLVDADPSDIRSIPGIRRRVEAVRAFREASKKRPTQEAAARPAVFAEIRQPQSRFIVVPQHTSELRRYVPFGYFDPDYIVHNSCSAIPNATLYHFGVLSSIMHMVWVRTVCGRIKSDFRYSTTLVYNNFPWPGATTPAKRGKVEVAAEAVIEVRRKYGGSTLADLYDPIAMPHQLVQAHKTLDTAVDRCYRRDPFTTDRLRLEFLFAKHDLLVNPLTPTAGRGRRRDGR